jgi:hypothetical protein
MSSEVRLEVVCVPDLTDREIEIVLPLKLSRLPVQFQNPYSNTIGFECREMKLTR